MIPRAEIIEWRQAHPWQGDDQVEQDLLLTRALIDIFSVDDLGEMLAFRGGTALHKLYLQPPQRYSEDIDLVQMHTGPIGPIYDGIQKVLNPWLGKPSRKREPGVANLIYRTESTGPSVVPLKLKVEINTREHFSIARLIDKNFSAVSRWYTGQCNLTTYTLDELLGTKMRALFQRRKGRDLFDLWLGLTKGGANPEIVVSIFRQYMYAENTSVSRQEYLNNLTAKMAHPGFVSDIEPILVEGTDFKMVNGFSVVENMLISRLP